MTQENVDGFDKRVDYYPTHFKAVFQAFTMKQSLLELDPGADALLILQCPNLQRVHAVKEDDVMHEKEIPESKTGTSSRTKGKKKIKTPTNLDAITSLQPYQENGNPNEIQFRVSTKHLCIASPVFNRMIKGNFQESQPNDVGLLEIRASDWNTRAFLILLDIIHGHHSQVPRNLDLDTVAQIGLLVDYYDCLEIVQVFFDHWHAHLHDWWKYSWLSFDKGSMKSFGEAESILLFIAWTFRSPVVFRNLTISAIGTTSGLVETNLPIPNQIFDQIDQQRIGLLHELFSRLYTLQENLFVGQIGCSLECSCRLLGYLMKQMRDQGLPMMKPEQPFLGFNVTSVADFIRGIKTPPWYSKKQNLDPCKLEKTLHLDMEGLGESLAGLSLEGFSLEPGSSREASGSLG
ncbi:uncharacterized protein FIESC28_03096 [Fusarium coffeatum]|uniref:BTB domain-containing protein n=1 Tax=Fusarium coffeatum TaxID=231269 RepID=A0A366S449_9HYPO|nr:uncharacterized protein FIESC28_03096 [Fusarium coffeatum]RBR24097.1 hypothetical protein FIESC28_03096 [Fusarium coffeatum]